MVTLNELCLAVDGELSGDGNLEITGVGSLEGAGTGEIAPIDSKQYLKQAATSKAGAFLVSRKLDVEFDRPCILHDFPLVALNRFMEILGLFSARRPEPGVHPTAVVGADLDESVTVGPYAVIEEGATLGKRCVVAAHAVIEKGAVLGDDCTIEPGAVIHDGAVIGDRVTIGAQAVISRQGFGFAPGPRGPVRLHHIGTVRIGSDVHIGAGTMIDRARFDETTIGDMTALDNLIHIAHNCRVGARTFVAAQTGLAGNAYIGDDCQVGGQVGFANHTGVGDRSLVGAKTGLMKPFPDNSDIAWYPARPRKEVFRLLAKLTRD